MDSLILASASPRRGEILRSLGARFAVRPVTIDERPRPGERAAELAERLACEKARAAAASRPMASAEVGHRPSTDPLEGPSPLVLGADTVVGSEGEILGKPRDEAEAARMLALLQGRTHDVWTGVALLAPRSGRLESAVDRTLVTFAAMTAGQIAEAVATTTPLDKAGAYGIQDPGTWFVTHVEGSFTNVVGLPTEILAVLLARFGVTFADLA